MNKFIAMLKDSYKEAVDGWIFFVMLILGGILVVLTLSLSVTPVPAEEALTKILQADAMRVVNSDRGSAKRIGLFFYQIEATDIVVGKPSDQPWNDEFQFNISFKSAGFGPSGVEVNDTKQPDPKDVKQIEGGGLFSDILKDATRYWASNSQTKEKPKYTDELGIAFVKYQLENAGEFKIKDVKKLPSGQFQVSASGVTSRNAWTHKPSFLFGAVKLGFFQRPLGKLIFVFENTLINGIGAWVVLLAGVIVTAGFIPNMLRKGGIDLLLTKPMSRPSILFYKYIGGLLFVFILTAITIGGIWAAVGLRTGIWAPGLLYCIFGITFYFAILYAVSTLVGVLTRNAIVSIVVTIVFWFLLWLIGTTYSVVSALDKVDPQRGPRAAAREKQKGNDPGEGKGVQVQVDSDEDEGAALPKWLVTTSTILNTITPRTNDLDQLTGNLIGRDLLSTAEKKQATDSLDNIAWGEVLSISGVYILLFLGLAIFRFVTRSY
ncbi:MAG: ABC transporter permease [Gemmataceae bacterium]